MVTNSPIGCHTYSQTHSKTCMGKINSSTKYKICAMIIFIHAHTQLSDVFTGIVLHYNYLHDTVYVHTTNYLMYTSRKFLLKYVSTTLTMDHFSGKYIHNRRNAVAI